MCATQLRIEVAAALNPAGTATAGRGWGWCGRMLGYAAAYVALAALGAITADWSLNVIALWLPSGLALYIVLHEGWEAWPSILLGSLACTVLLTPHVPLLTAIVIACGNTEGALLAFALLDRVFAVRNPFADVRSVILFLVFGVLLPTALAAAAGIATIVAGNLESNPDWLGMWRVWWLGDVVGTLLLAPLLLALHQERIDFRPAQREWWQLLAGSVGTALLVTIGIGLLRADVLLLLLLPFVLWASSRFGAFRTALVTLLISFAVLAGTLIAGSSDPRTRSEQILQLQLIIACLSWLGMLIVATLDQQRRLGEALRASSAELQRLNQSLEHQVHERTRQLQEVNSELEAFSYSVSHDLRAPLRSIHGYSSWLSEDEGERLSAAGRDLLARIQGGVLRMGTLIEAFIDLSRIGSTPQEVRALDLSAMAQAVIGELREKEPERRVELRIEPGLRANADEKLVRILLANLIGNAWKYTGRTEQARIEFRRIAHEGNETFMIADNGAGFAMEFAAKLFTPFMRMHAGSEFEGTGIGLATCRRVVQKLGGRIWAESAVSEGSRFYFTLPP